MGGLVRSTRKLLSPRRNTAGAVALALALAAPITFAASPASATQAAFCHTIRTERPVRPTNRLYSSWHPFVTKYLGYFQRLDGEAPPLMGRRALNGLVAVLENFTTAANDAQIAADIAARPRWWSIGWSKFYGDFEYCATHPSV